MHMVKAPDTEPIPGYRLVEPLGKGGFGEVWKCEAPGGLFKAIKFITGDNHHILDAQGGGAEQELRALQHIRAIRHPFLLSIERVEVIDGEVMIVMELADRSLHDLFVEYRTAGKPGIPRAELLGYMREAAEALDLLNQEHGLQHLDIKPRNLFLIGRHVKVADFGLVTSLSDQRNPLNWVRQHEAVTPLYASPETFLGRFTLFSDQYSLAISYHELLTGGLPFTGSNFRQLAMRHVQDPPDLERLAEVERPIVGRALAKEPRDRFPSCSEFILALATLREVPPPRVLRSHGTMHDVRLGELAATPPGSRQVRAVQRPTPTEPTTAASPSPTSTSASDPPKDSSAFLAGYQLLECVSRHAAAEVWKAQTSDGHKRLVKLINGYDPAEERPDGDPLTRLQGLRHDRLPHLEIQVGAPARLALITGAPDGTLSDRLRECQQIGQAGIPRLELLDYLRAAAEALDELYLRHRLQHLCLTPRQLVLRNGQLFLLDFAVLELLWLPAGHDPAALNTRYAAPELFERQFSRHCDQYSLALIYQELLTGIHAFRNLNQRQMALARLRGKPDLGLLPATDRPVVSQAVHIDPDQRFPNCTAFVDALEGVSVERGVASSLRATRVQSATVSVPRRPTGSDSAEPAAASPEKGSSDTIRAVRSSGRIPKVTTASAKSSEIQWDRPVEEMKQIIAEYVVAAAGDWEIYVSESLRFRLRRAQAKSASRVPARRGAIDAIYPTLEHFACGRILPSTVQLRLSDFEREWQAERVKPAEVLPNLGPAKPISSAGLLYQVQLRGNLWQRCLGRTPSLLVQLDLLAPQHTSEALTDVMVRLRARDCGPEQAEEFLQSIGPRLVRGLRNHLQLPAERRGDERIARLENVQVHPMHNERELGEGLVAQTRDISLGGMGLYLPCRPPSEYLLAQISPRHRAPLTVPLLIVHAHACGDGRYHIGARFAWEIVQQ